MTSYEAFVSSFKEEQTKLASTNTVLAGFGQLITILAFCGRQRGCLQNRFSCKNDFIYITLHYKMAPDVMR